MSGTWCTIESDPGVFTELIEQFGVKGVQVEELYSLDQSEFQRLGKIYGLVFLFKWREEVDEREPLDPSIVPNVFFANQVITNACATQAILSVLLNAESVDIGDTLREFKTFTETFPADFRGLAISNSDIIREAHNSFARNDPFVMEDSARPATKEDDVYHFIAYVPVQGLVYELDGLKGGPIVLGDAEDWLATVRPAIEDRMARYSQEEIRFNLLAITSSKLEDCREKLTQLEGLVAEVDATLAMGGTDDDVVAEAQARRVELQAAVHEAQQELHEEEQRRAAHKRENVRRRHNYIPFAVALLKHMATAGQLGDAIARADAKLKEQAEQNAQKGQK